MQNYHRHTSYSNIYVADSAATNEDYAKRAIELGHKVISSVEHGWQGKYHETYELSRKYGLKFVFGAEAYWVKDRHEKDRTNSHIILLAKTEVGRRSINRILSIANEDGYYFRPRVDIDLLLSLPPKDVMVTTACVAFWHYDDIENILFRLYEHFGDNLFLEIQYHATEKQISLNKRIKSLADQYGIELIVGMDSHYIYPEQAQEREYILEAKNIHYEDEDGWYMDYPDDDTTLSRFLKQGVFTEKQVKRAMDNTDLLLQFEDYADGNPVFSKDIKLPTLYPGKTQEERNQIYSRLITKQFKEYMKSVPANRHQEYFEGVKGEVAVYKNTGMVDYPLIDYRIVRRAIEKGGLITNTGRGSGVGYFTNTLCGFSKVDRFTSPIKLYPERFISESRILETKSLPDLDLNCGNPEVFAEAQTEVLGADHAVAMIAFGTCKKKAAFKLYARSQNLDPALANEISKQIGQYDDAVKNADDDEKDEINIYDFVDKQYHSYVDASKKYWGIIMDKKKAPCAYLLYQGSIREEIGLIKCKSDSTKKEFITTVIDGAIAENYKFLKNDLLKVDVVLLVDLMYRRAGISIPTVTELSELVKNDQAVWDIYARGLTIGVNQCEKESTIRKVMKYKPHNISELAAFIAAIRPAFKSMYSKLENRDDFSYGIPAFDKILQTPEMPQSFILYQEQMMNTLNYAGFLIDECYGIIKSIAKKHPEKVRPLKAKFLDGFSTRIMKEDGVSEPEAHEMSEKVWQIISDACGYGFNSAHAYCMALDSLYGAYFKAHHPYEFYEVMLQLYSDKGNKDKVAALKQEMFIGFGIKEGPYQWGADNRKFKADESAGVIYPSLLSIKGLSQKNAVELYEMAKRFTSKNFYNLYKALKQVKSLDSGKLNILIEIGYFINFGSIGKIKSFMQAVDVLYERTQFNKQQLPENYAVVIRNLSEETEKQCRRFDFDKALYQIWNELPDDDCGVEQKLCRELKHMGYLHTTISDISPEYAFVQDIDSKYRNPVVSLYRLSNGETEKIKVRKNAFDAKPFEIGQIIKTIEKADEGRWFKKDDGWEPSEDQSKEWMPGGNGFWQHKTETEPILKKWTICR